MRTKKRKKKQETADDDDFDPFGDETEEDVAAAAELKKKQEDDKKKKAAKPKIIAKSDVVFDVKCFEVDQDFEGLASKIKKDIKMDGLVWMDIHKVLPVAFGMKKLQMRMIIEDEKIATDNVFEIIESWEDEVQSTDIVTFSKA